MDSLSIEALTQLAESDPESLDLALLAPLQEQLGALGEDDPVREAMAAAVNALSSVQHGRLDALAKELTDDWQAAVKAKQPVEQRWIEDERQFMGRSRINDSKAYPGDSADPMKSAQEPITVHATRSRTLMCWGRLSDMMLPANDFPMRVDAPDKPVPGEFPSLAQAVQEAVAQGGNADTVLNEAAERSAQQMQSRVFQILRDSQFQAACRRALLDASRIGCGLIKGPFPTLKHRRRFGADKEFNIEETATAGIKWVDPWKWWYDMTPTLDKASATYEVEIISKRELTEFKRYPRVLVGVVDELLKEEHPKLEGEFRAAVQRRNTGTDMCEPLDDVYALLETHKVLDGDRLRKVMGIEWPHDDPPVVHLWSINGRCVKFKITPLERDFRLDYYNLTIMPADDTIFGYGYPYLARASQRFADGAVRATLANAAASVAPILAVSKGKVQPNREQWRISGLNVFSVENGEIDLSKFIHSVSVDSHVEQNLKMLQVAGEMMDQDTLFNQLLQGNVSGEEMPASGVVALSNISSVFQRSIAAYADDNCFQPLCERLIWWERLYGAPIEGDFQPKAIAATQLVSKDLALQHTQVAINMSGLPQFAGYSDQYELYSAFMSNIDGLPNRDAIVLPKKQALENQQAIQEQTKQGNPDQAAKIASEERIAMAKIQSAERLAALDQQSELLRAQTQLQVASMDLRRSLIELQMNKEVDLSKMSVELEKASMTDATSRMTATLDAAITARVEAAKLHSTPSPYSAKD